MDEATRVWDWAYTLEVIPVLAKAAIVTVEATFLSFAFAAVVGLGFALLRMGGGVVGWITSAFVEMIRSTPLLIQIFFIFFVLPRYGISLDAFTAGIIALSLHYACYCSEVYRAGLEAVPRGQWEACTALNLNSWNTFKNIVLPQAIPPIVPALGNLLVALFKDTPLLSAIAVLELVQTAKILGSENFRYTEPMTLVGVIFLILSLVSSAGIRWLERRLTSGACDDRSQGSTDGAVRRRHQALWRADGARRPQPRNRPRREGGDHRPVGLGQDHRAPHADDLGTDRRRRHLGRRRAPDPTSARAAAWRRPTPSTCAGCGPRSAWCSSTSICSRT